MNAFVQAVPWSVAAPPIGPNDVLRAVVGEQISISTRLRLPDGQPATRENSSLCFALAENVGGTTLLTLSWNDPEVQRVDDEGLVCFTLPTSRTDTLRRGDYAISVMLMDSNRRQERVSWQATLQLTYATTSPHKSVPYAQPGVGTTPP